MTIEFVLLDYFNLAGSRWLAPPVTGIYLPKEKRTMVVTESTPEKVEKVVRSFSPERWATLRRISGERSEAARWREEQKARGICPAIKIMEDLVG